MPTRTDLAKARQLLAEAGFATGFKTTFTINVGSAAITEADGLRSSRRRWPRSTSKWIFKSCPTPR
jgi:hypothetical protein